MGAQIPEPLKQRLAGLRHILLAHHEAGALLPSATKGSERETVVRDLLEKCLPPTFRIGRGAITDVEGSMSGQIDVVVEYPFLPSFPTPGADDRLYLADSTALALEIKSNLESQWEQVGDTAAQVAPLKRKWLSPVRSMRYEARSTERRWPR